MSRSLGDIADGLLPVETSCDGVALKVIATREAQ